MDSSLKYFQRNLKLAEFEQKRIQRWLYSKYIENKWMIVKLLASWNFCATKQNIVKILNNNYYFLIVSIMISIVDMLKAVPATNLR